MGLIVLLAAAFAVLCLYLAHVVRDDDRGHAFTHRRPPASHLGFGEDRLRPS
ncbi:hypothetical protein [Georgenia sp. AZ-5]|uniref:hypothetical protein n=1 Tax=Georgenia sp. AZ-5 TaxID=3367526 RepID=UPI0037547A6F